MKTRAIALALLVSLTPATLSQFAFAEASDDAETRAARTRFQEGVGHYDKGQYEIARAAFLQAYALKKHPAVLLNLAQSCLKGNHPMEAARYFQQYLREVKDPKPESRRDAEKGLADARQKLGRVEVSAPTGAEVFMDEQRVGFAPLSELVDVEPGNHNVKATPPGGKTDSQAFIVAAGQKVSLRLGPSLPAPPLVPVAATSTPATEPADDKPQTTVKVSRGLFAPPKTWAPVIAGATVGVIGTALGIYFGIQKGNAQSNADAVSQAIKDNGGGRGTCISTSPDDVRRFGAACNALKDNLDSVDSDATVANVSIAVGVAGFVTAVGWWMLGPKKEATAPAAAARPVIVPMVGRGFGGVGVGGQF